MKILLISEEKRLPPSYFKMFEGDYIESRSDVTIRYTIQSAKEFLTNTIIERQKHLDFIIADYNILVFYLRHHSCFKWY